MPGLERVAWVLSCLRLSLLCSIYSTLSVFTLESIVADYFLIQEAILLQLSHITCIYGAGAGCY